MVLRRQDSLLLEHNRTLELCKNMVDTQQGCNLESKMGNTPLGYEMENIKIYRKCIT